MHMLRNDGPNVLTSLQALHKNARWPRGVGKKRYSSSGLSPDTQLLKRSSA